MNRIAFVVTYLAGVAVAVALLNANTGNELLPVAIWAVASVLLGWGMGKLDFALLTFLAIPFSVPFGYPDNYLYSEPLPIWWSVMFLAFASAGLVVLTALMKRIVESRRHRRASS